MRAGICTLYKYNHKCNKYKYNHKYIHNCIRPWEWWNPYDNGTSGREAANVKYMIMHWMSIVNWTQSLTHQVKSIDEFKGMNLLEWIETYIGTVYTHQGGVWYYFISTLNALQHSITTSGFKSILGRDLLEKYGLIIHLQYRCIE